MTDDRSSKLHADAIPTPDIQPSDVQPLLQEPLEEKAEKTTADDALEASSPAIDAPVSPEEPGNASESAEGRATDLMAPSETNETIPQEPLAESAVDDDRQQAPASAPEVIESDTPEPAPLQETVVPDGEHEKVEADAALAPLASEGAPEPTAQVEDTDSSAPSQAAVPESLSLAGRCFTGLAHVGWLVLLLLTGAVTALGLVTRKLTLPSDAHWNAVLQSLSQGNNWLFFSVDGTVVTPLPPVYIWFLSALERIPGLAAYLPTAFVPQAGAALSLLLCVFVTWMLARGTGHSPRAALAAGCLVLTSLTLSGFAVCAGPGLLFASLITLSLFFLYRGWISPSAPLSLLLGFVLAGVATLALTPLGMALPLLASLLFLFWRSTFRRAGQRDGAFGFAVMLILVLGWLTWLAITPEAKNYLGAVLQSWQVRDVPAVISSWWVPLLVLALLTRPWILLLLVAPWERLYRLPVVFWKARHEAPGSGWIWWSLLGGLALLPFMVDPAAAALPLLPLLAIVGGKALVNLTSGRSRLLFGLMGILLLALSLLLGVAALLPQVAPWLPQGLLTSLDASLAGLPCVGSRLSPVLPLLSAVQGLAILAGLSFLTSLLLLKCTNTRQPYGGLLVFVLYVVLLVQPIVYLTLPSLMAYLAG